MKPGTASRSASNRPRSTRSRRRRRGRRLQFAGILALVAYAGWFLIGCLAQEYLIFPAMLIQPSARGYTRPRVDEIWRETPDGIRVEAWYKGGRGVTPACPGPAVIYFHGNYDLIDTRWIAVEPYLDMGISALAVEYRGYGRSTGMPSQAAVVDDAVWFFDWLSARPEVDPRRIVIQGLSLGGGVAAALADKRPPAALILECTFFNMLEMANRHLLPASICRNPFRTDRTVAKLDCPILLLHGRNDWKIPIDHSRRLAKLANNARLLQLNCGHGSYFTDWSAISTWLLDCGVIQRPQTSVDDGHRAP